MRPTRASDRDTADRGKQTCDYGGKATASDTREEAGPAERHMHARNEHQHREPDLGQERRRRLFRIEPTKAASPDDHAGGELAHHHRNERASTRRKQRPRQPGQDDQGKDTEAHRLQFPPIPIRRRQLAPEIGPITWPVQARRSDHGRSGDMPFCRRGRVSRPPGESGLLVALLFLERRFAPTARVTSGGAR